VKYVSYISETTSLLSVVSAAAITVVQDNQVDPSDLFDDADDGLLLDAANDSDGGGSIPGIDTDVEDDDDNDDIDNASTADSIAPATAAASVSVPGMQFLESVVSWFS